MKNEIEEIYQIFLKNKSVKSDSRKIKKDDIFFAISGDNFNANKFAKEALKKGASLVILDDENFFNSKNKKMILVKNSLKTMQKLAKKYRESLEIPFLAITGSNGKTTTKELLRDILSTKYKVWSTVGNLNNQIGVPLTILSIKEKHNFVIVEIGANHRGEIKEMCKIVQPNFGLITNISKAHLGEFGSLENITKAKMELSDFLEKKDGYIFKNFKSTQILKDDFFLIVKIFGKKVTTNLIGAYNAKNIGVVIKVGKYFKIEQDKIIKAISKYQPKNNRSQFLKTKTENNIFLDAYNANPESMKLSLESFFSKKLKNKIIIIGAMKELGKYSSDEHKKILNLIRKKVKQDLNVEKVFLVGSEFYLFKDKYNFYFFQNRAEIERFLKKNKIEKKHILIKGSRGISLEKIVKKKLI